jgi:cell division protein FtsI/penicillin-binding protein 2
MRRERLLRVIWILGGIVAILIGRMVQLQWFEHDEWAERARRSRLEKRTIPAQRGRILDQQGRVLAEDRRSFDLMFEYRDFRRGQLSGQLLEAFHLMAVPCGGLQDCLDQAEAMGDILFAWKPADLAGLTSRNRGDLLFYLRRLGKLPRSQALPIEAWATNEQGPSFGQAFPQARENFAQRIPATRTRIQELEQALWDRLELPLLSRLEIERQKLETRIRQEALRIAAGQVLVRTPWEVRTLLAQPTPGSVKSSTSSSTDASTSTDALAIGREVERHLALEELARRWQWPGGLEQLATLISPAVDQEVDAAVLGSALALVENQAPADLAGVRRDLVSRIHRDRVALLVRGVRFEVVDLLGLDPAGNAGLYIETSSTRIHPIPLAPQIVGSVRVANENDLAKYLNERGELRELGRLLVRSPRQEKRYRELRSSFLRSTMRPGDVRGMQGIESAFEHVLRGERGYLRMLAGWEVDDRNRELEFVAPTNGRDVQLALDASLLRAAERAIPEAYKIVADTLPASRAIARPFLREPRVGFALLNLQDGSVPLLATWPTYQPKDLRLRYQELVEDRVNNVFRNRALGGGFILGNQAPYPGSTFKLLVAVEALSKDPDAWQRKIYCGNKYLPPGLVASERVRPLECMNHSARELNMHDAIMLSCNTYFYTLGREIGWQRLWQRARQLGFGSPTATELVKILEVELPPEQREGDYDDGKRYRVAATANGILERNANLLRSRHAEFNAFTMAHFAIGQAYVQASPLQMARFYGWLATGRLWTPRLVLKSGGAASAVPAEPQVPLDPWVQQRLKGAMKDVVFSPQGTANDPRYPLELYKVAGKTGTAQTGLSSPNHAWFVGYFPYDAPKYAFAILCENVELHGGEIANLVLYQFLQSPEARAYFATTEN